MRCHCGRPAVLKHPASGSPLCTKHFFRYVHKRVLRAASSVGVLKCEELTVDPSLGEIEAKIFVEALTSRRKPCPKPKILEGGEVKPFSLEKVLFFLLKYFYEGDREALTLADPVAARNPAYVLLPYEVALYAKLKGWPPSQERFSGALWEVALEVATSQPTEAYSALKVLDRLKGVLPIP